MNVPNSASYVYPERGNTGRVKGEKRVGRLMHEENGDDTEEGKKQEEDDARGWCTRKITWRRSRWRLR